MHWVYSGGDDKRLRFGPDSVKISETGLDLIKAHEGLRLTAYPDPGTGGEPWTIGYGHTGSVKDGDQITEAQATYFLRSDVQWAEGCIADHVSVDLTQNQFDALCSFVFNVGFKTFTGSTLCSLINEGNFDAAATQFKRWNHAGGKVLAGLTTRRQREADLFAA